MSLILFYLFHLYSGKCKPKRFDAIFDIGDHTYIIVGSFVYLFDTPAQSRKLKKAWPRLTKEVFGVDGIKEATVLEGFLYLFLVSL